MTSERPLVRRYYGSETEYSYSTSKSPTPPINHLSIPPDVPHFAQFLGNGGRLYLDIGLIEYATPECDSLAQLVAHELAGEFLASYASSKEPLVNALFKRSASPNGRLTYGSHENYSTLVEVPFCDEVNIEPEIAALAAHFATRTIFTGAGLQIGTSPYKLGQKMQGITRVIGNGNTSHKALVNTRQEHWNGFAKERRLHVVCGDANVSPWVIRMKFGTTSLVLRLLEDKIKLKTRLVNPLQAAWDVADGVEGLSTSLPLVGGKSTTAIEIQRFFLEKSKELSKVHELPPEEIAVLNDWEKVLDALSEFAENNVEDPILYQLDWFVRMKANERTRNKTPKPTRKDIGNYDLRFDLIPDGVGVALRTEGRIFSRYCPSDEEIQSAIHLPPLGRARLRGKAVQVGKTRLTKINWDTIQTDSGEIIMPLNGDYSETGIEAALAKLFG